MRGQRASQTGFSVVAVVIAVLAVGVVGVGGVLVYQHHRTTAKQTANANWSQATSQQKSATTTQTQSDPYAGWQTYKDTGNGVASGISIKYPPDWYVDTTSTKGYGWSIVETTNTKNIITVNDIFQDGSQTARQVWEACEGTDACNGGSGARTLSDSESTINGLDAYAATIQTDYGTYHMTMIRGNRSTSPAGTPYVWFTTYSTDQAVLSIFAKIMGSASFAN